MGLPVVNAIWIGREMGPIHSACLASFVKTDHTVVLHAYGPVEDAPKGVRLTDANRLLPEQRLLKYSNGSYSLSANLMRYELLRRGEGLYVDCDVYCVRPAEDEPFMLGWQNPDYINCAVMKVPPDSPMLASLCSISEGWTPPWSPHQPPTSLSDLPWGTTGPIATTWYAKEHGLVDRAKPFDVYYPVPHERWSQFYDPGLELRDLVTARTNYVHLWHQMPKHVGVETALDPRSPIGKIVQDRTRSWWSIWR